MLHKIVIVFVLTCDFFSFISEKEEAEKFSDLFDIKQDDHARIYPNTVNIWILKAFSAQEVSQL